MLSALFRRFKPNRAWWYLSDPFPTTGSYCRSRLKNEVYMYVWLVCCGSIRRLIISFALKEYSHTFFAFYLLYMIVCCCSIPRLIISFALNGSYCRSRLKNELYKYVWVVCCGSIDPSIDNFFRSKGVFTHLLRSLFELASSLTCFFVYTWAKFVVALFLERGITHFIRLFVYLCWRPQCGRNLWSLFV